MLSIIKARRAINNSSQNKSLNVPASLANIALADESSDKPQQEIIGFDQVSERNQQATIQLTKASRAVRDTNVTASLKNIIDEKIDARQSLKDLNQKIQETALSHNARGATRGDRFQLAVLKFKFYVAGGKRALSQIAALEAVKSGLSAKDSLNDAANGLNYDHKKILNSKTGLFGFGSSLFDRIAARSELAATRANTVDSIAPNLTPRATARPAA